MTLMSEVYEFVLPEMAANGIEDTTLNRATFLKGMVDAWIEDGAEEHPNKPAYIAAVQSEIIDLILTYLREE